MKESSEKHNENESENEFVKEFEDFFCLIFTYLEGDKDLGFKTEDAHNNYYSLFQGKGSNKARKIKDYIYDAFYAENHEFCSYIINCRNSGKPCLGVKIRIDDDTSCCLGLVVEKDKKGKEWIKIICVIKC